MNVVVDSVLRIPFGERVPRVEDRLFRRLRFHNPAYLRQPFAKRRYTDVPEFIDLFDSDSDRSLVIPRGAVAVLKDAAKQCGEPVRFDDQRRVCAPVDYEFNLELRDYQEDATAALVRHVQGCAVLPCGAGKSAVVLAAIAQVQQPALILVHTLDLVEQWVENVRKVLGVEPGVIAGGKARLADVTVATLQTIAALDRDVFDSVRSRFGCVVQDECHRGATPLAREILAHLPAKYRWGVTATPERPDGLGELLELTLGRIVYRIEPKALIDAGHLTSARVEVIHTGTYADGSLEFGPLVDELTRDADRNRLLLCLMKREADAGHAVLVLTGRVAHAQALAADALRAGVRAAALTGDTARAIRGKVLARFKAGELDVLCATSLADEGVDIPRLTRLILATPAAAKPRTMQRLGRLMRPHPGKAPPLLYDLVDEHPIAIRQHGERLQAFRAVLGADVTPSTSARSQHL